MREKKQQVSKRLNWGEKKGGNERERETREEVKCNRGFIVCGSLGRELGERRREREEQGGRR